MSTRLHTAQIIGSPRGISRLPAEWGPRELGPRAKKTPPKPNDVRPKVRQRLCSPAQSNPLSFDAKLAAVVAIATTHRCLPHEGAVLLQLLRLFFP